MAKGDFDYKRAWEELAEPAFLALPQDTRDLYHDVVNHFAHHQQMENLDMPWPKPEHSFEGMNLRERFEKIPAEILGHACKVIYWYGHWGEGCKLPLNGGYWRFQRWAQQVLREKNVYPGDNPPWDLEPYKEKGEDEKAVIEALKGSGLSLYKIENVNHKPHPYCIGSQHLEKNDSHILSSESIERMERDHGVRCAMRGCKVPFREHTSDRVVFLKFKGTVLNEEKVELTEKQKKVLGGMEALMKEHKLDGFGFVK